MILHWSPFLSIVIVITGLLLNCTSAVDTPAAGAGSPATPPSHPPAAGGYIHSLSLEQVKRLGASFSMHQDRHSDPTVPFYGRVPLYSAATDPSVVQQALRDHKSVGIVDTVNGRTSWIFWEEGEPGRLWQKPFPNSWEVLAVFALPPEIHKLKKALSQFAHRRLRQELQDVDDAIHVRGSPILAGDRAMLGHMLAASTQDHQAFVIARDQSQHSLIRPLTDHMVEARAPGLDQEIAQVRRFHYGDTQKYGSVFASLKWGRPLVYIPQLALSQQDQPRDTDLPLLKAKSATRQQMIDALAAHRGFQLRAKGRLYTVMLQRAGSSTAPPGLLLAVDAGQKVGVMQKAAVWLNRLHL